MAQWRDYVTTWRLVFVVYVGFVLVGVVGDWWEKHQKAQAEEDKRARMAAVGMDASMAATQLLGAYKACVIVGLPNISQCAKDEGPLPQDMSAALLASLALEQHNAYSASCTKVYDAKYCNDLFQRAWDVTWNARASSQ